MRIADLTSMAQLRILGMGHAGLRRYRIPELKAYPSSAIEPLLRGIQMTQERRQRLLSLDRLPSELSAAIGAIVASFSAWQAEVALAFSGAAPAALARLITPAHRLASARLDDSAQTPESARLLIEAGLDFSAAFAARREFVAAVAWIRNVLGTTPIGETTSSGVPPILCLDLEGVDTTYSSDCMLTLDVGGNDVYQNNAGGSGWDAEDCSLAAVGRTAALVDLAGNDRYVGNGDCGANGGAFVGFGLLLDAAGDDVYQAQSNAVNGGGGLGAGFLLDAGGNDTYVAVKDAVNGGGFAGTGLLIDTEGDDTYRAESGPAVNGGGAASGSGALIDLAGRDDYLAVLGCGGSNGGAYAASGFLVDLFSERHPQFFETGNCILGQNGGAHVGSVICSHTMATTRTRADRKERTGAAASEC